MAEQQIQAARARFRFTFQACQVVEGHPKPLNILPFEGTWAEMEAYIKQKTAGIALLHESYRIMTNERIGPSVGGEQHLWEIYDIGDGGEDDRRFKGYGRAATEEEMIERAIATHNLAREYIQVIQKKEVW